jgi:hypothetical protein
MFKALPGVLVAPSVWVELPSYPLLCVNVHVCFIS